MAEKPINFTSISSAGETPPRISGPEDFSDDCRLVETLQRFSGHSVGWQHTHDAKRPRTTIYYIAHALRYCKLARDWTTTNFHCGISL